MGFYTKTELTSKHFTTSAFSFFIFIIVSLHGQVLASDNPYIGLRIPSTEKYGLRLYTKQLERGISMLDFTEPSIREKPKTIKRKIDIDSTGKKITIEEKAFNYPLFLPAIYSLKDYTNYCLEKNIDILWQTFKIKHLTGERIDRKRRDWKLPSR